VATKQTKRENEIGNLLNNRQGVRAGKNSPRHIGNYKKKTDTPKVFLTGKLGTILRHEGRACCHREAEQDEHKKKRKRLADVNAG